MTTLKSLIESTTGSESILGTVLEHAVHGRAVLVEIDRRNNLATVWHESQAPGMNGFRNILYSQDEYIVVKPFSLETAEKAMAFFLS